MHIRDLVQSRDGSLSLTKLAASTAHFLMAVAFARSQILDGNYTESLWLMYGGFAIAHASFDKSAAMFKDFKEKSLEPRRSEEQ